MEFATQKTMVQQLIESKDKMIAKLQERTEFLE